MRPTRTAVITMFLVTSGALAGCIQPEAPQNDVLVAVGAYGFFVNRIAAGDLTVTVLDASTQADPTHLARHAAGARLVLVTGQDLDHTLLDAAEAEPGRDGPMVHVLTSGIELIATASSTITLDDGHDHAANEDDAHAGHGHDAGDDDGHAAADDDNGHAGHGHGHVSSGTDPHIWLDPLRTQILASNIRDALSALDPDNASRFAERAAGIQTALAALDEEYRFTLRQCATRHIAVTEPAYAYVAHRYNLYQHHVPMVPEVGPTRHALERLDQLGERFAVTHLLVHGPIPPQAQNRIGATGYHIAPIDAMTAQATTDERLDYFGVMARNLDALRTAGRCT